MYGTLFKILDNKDIFIWKNDSLEDTIGSVFTGNSFMEKFKTKLEKLSICSFDKGKLSTLAKEMCKSDEIQRFLNFFQSKERARGDRTKEVLYKKANDQYWTLEVAVNESNVSKPCYCNYLFLENKKELINFKTK